LRAVFIIGKSSLTLVLKTSLKLACVRDKISILGPLFQITASAGLSIVWANSGIVMELTEWLSAVKQWRKREYSEYY